MTSHEPTDHTDQPDSVDTIESGGDSRRLSRRSRQSLLAVTASLALVVAVASGAALAGDGADGTGQLAVSAAGSASPSGDDERRDGFRGRGHAFSRGFGHGPMLGAPLHGTFVVPDRDGGYRTVVAQRGEVTAVSGSSLTVRSEDGFVATYRLTDATDVLGGTGGVADLVEGDDVSVSAEREGAVNTATHVADLDRMVDLRRNHPGLPRPRSTSTAEGTAARV